MSAMNPIRRCDECGHRKPDVNNVPDPAAKDGRFRKLCPGCYQDRASRA